MGNVSAMFDLQLSLKFAAAFVALANPLYGIPIFLDLTQDFTVQQRRRTAFVGAFTVFVAATIATLIGEEILRFFGIDVPAFQIAGGIIVLGIGLSMLNDSPSKGDAKAIENKSSRGSSVAVVPLSIPLTIGPGAFATVILFSHQLSDGSEIMTMVPVIVLISLIIWVALLFAGPIAKKLGTTGISVVSRIMAIILAAVAVEMMISGIVQVYHEHFAGTAAPASS
ncbi:MAG: MarC family protein [Pseudomonadota bacterium]